MNENKIESFNVDTDFTNAATTLNKSKETGDPFPRLIELKVLELLNLLNNLITREVEHGYYDLKFDDSEFFKGLYHARVCDNSPETYKNQVKYNTIGYYHKDWLSKIRPKVEEIVTNILSNKGYSTTISEVGISEKEKYNLVINISWEKPKVVKIINQCTDYENKVFLINAFDAHKKSVKNIDKYENIIHKEISDKVLIQLEAINDVVKEASEYGVVKIQYDVNFSNTLFWHFSPYDDELYRKVGYRMKYDEYQEITINIFTKKIIYILKEKGYDVETQFFHWENGPKCPKGVHIQVSWDNKN